MQLSCMNPDKSNEIQVLSRCYVGQFANAYRAICKLEDHRIFQGIIHPHSLMRLTPSSQKFNDCPFGKEKKCVSFILTFL